MAENGLTLLSPLKSEPGGVGLYATMAIENVEMESARVNGNGNQVPMSTD